MKEKYCVVVEREDMSKMKKISEENERSLSASVRFAIKKFIDENKKRSENGNSTT